MYHPEQEAQRSNVLCPHDDHLPVCNVITSQRVSTAHWWDTLVKIKGCTTYHVQAWHVNGVECRRTLAWCQQPNGVQSASYQQCICLLARRSTVTLRAGGTQHPNIWVPTHFGAT